SGTPQLVNVIRINSGGGAQNFGGEAWVADQYFTGGTPYSTTSAISNTTQDQIYQSERFGNFTYAIPVPSSGTYAVDLHLAEIYFNATGSRTFNINIEDGQFVRTNLDLIQLAGSINRAYVLRADNLSVLDGTLNITFTTGINNAKISGISVGQYIRETAIARKIFSDEIPQLPSPSERYSAESFIFPNPAGANITLSLNVKSEGEYNLSMWNLSGADLQLGVFTLSRGHQLLDLDLSTLGLNAGLYILAIEGPGEKQYLRFAIR
ncbi:malectin domain-containing carbohydrate-binding protein, partial [Chryseolinea sp. H1M3-3]|uniref:malectin domain-containing carbohydrate-binding protein n=1 Tax=Chryseolinea sp. H1M3-3 TaxID=3034144 RepID=UPI0023EDE2B2